MGRTIKAGLDYFPLEVVLDDKFELIEAKHGIKGFGMLIKLLQKIYQNSYYYPWTEKEQLLFSKRINVNINELNAVVSDCCDWKILNKFLYNKYKILTSRGIQKRYFEIVKRRKEIEVIKNYLIINIKTINVNIKVIDVDINGIDTNNGTQRKGKERKVKEIYNNAIQVLKYLNSKTNRTLDTNPEQENRKFLIDRLKEGISVSDCKSVIDVKFKDDYFKKDNFKFMRCSTLFRKSKFQNYLEEAKTKKQLDPDMYE